MRNKGFTLVELVVGIVVLAMAMLIMNTMLISQTQGALEPLYRLRASQLGQSIMQDILSRAYDENADHNGGLYRCGEESILDNSIQPCSTGTGTDSEAEKNSGHQNFNDVDDFITTGFVPAMDYGDVLGEALLSQYRNYEVNIEVVLFAQVSSDTAKKITVTIKTPSDEQIRFSALKGNY